ncbi:hypothetical protein [Pseudokineococcus sp. 1T1Z-3]|uniref:hypothetical protein n=1 Tax=Pseudokineococcus sp. 1T1Z-3 TaxID=3132745 RepID=UPI0030B780D0
MLVVLLGAGTPAVDRALAVVKEVQSARDSFTPVLVVDNPDLLPPVRRAGYVVELVGPYGLAETVREARKSYAADDVLCVVEDAVEGALASGLEAFASGGDVCLSAVERARRALRRLEHRLR